MTMFLLGKQGGHNALPQDGTAWIVMPDGLTYEIKDLKFGLMAIETEQVDTGERIRGKKVMRVQNVGKPRISFTGVAIERERAELTVVDTSVGLTLPKADGKTRFISLDDEGTQR